MSTIARSASRAVYPIGVERVVPVGLGFVEGPYPAGRLVPVDEYRRLRALERRASAEDLDAAEADVVLQSHREWVAAGRPGALSHEEAMAKLLGSAR
jgi:hypothetical protein